MSDYNKDEVIVITTGCYSDYSIAYLAKAKKNFMWGPIKKEFEKWFHENDKVNRKGDGIYILASARQDSFKNWFVNISGYADEIDHKEMDIGDYGWPVKD